MFLLAFTLPMPAQEQSSPPTLATKASPDNTLLSLSLRLLSVSKGLSSDLGKQSLQASDIVNSSEKYKQQARQLSQESGAYKAQAQAFETELKQIAEQFRLSSRDLSRLPNLLANYQEAVSKRSSDQQTALETAQKQRDAALLKASHWWIWLGAGIAVGIAADEGARRLLPLIPRLKAPTQ